MITLLRQSKASSNRSLARRLMKQISDVVRRGHDDSQPLPNVFRVASYRNEYTQLKSSGNFMIPIYFRGNFF